MSRNGLQAVLFDMDGLLVETEHLWFEVEAAVMARLGGSWEPADQLVLVGGSLERSCRYMLDRAGVDLPWQTVGRWLVEGMAQRLADGVAPRPGALELLGSVEAAGVPRALVSSSQRVLVDAVLADVGAHRFAFSVSGDDVTRMKPDPEPYRTAVRRLRAAAGRCVVLEDSPTGVAAGEAAGCYVVAVPSVAPIPARPGRTVVPSLTGLTVDDLAAFVS